MVEINIIRKMLISDDLTMSKSPLPEKKYVNEVPWMPGPPSWDLLILKITSITV